MEQIPLLVRQHVPRVIAANLVHGPSTIRRPAMLRRQDDRAETGRGEAVVLGCPYTAGVATASVVLAKIAVLGSQVETSTDNGTTSNTRADVEVFPVVELGIAGGAIRYCRLRAAMGFFPCHRKMIR